MRVISIVNMKGGVGKTTVTVALAETIAAVIGRKVLVLDLDSQASCSFALLGETDFDQMRTEQRHTYKLMSEMAPFAVERTPMDQLSWKNASRLKPAPALDLIGAVPALQKLERDVIFRMAKAGLARHAIERNAADHLRECFAEVSRDYDYCIIDCPPGISAFTEAAIRVSDIVIAPVVLEYLPVLGLEAFVLQTIRPLREQGGFRGKPHVLFNRVQGTRDEARFIELVREIEAAYGDDLTVLDVRLPQQPEFAHLVTPPDVRTSYLTKYAGVDALMDDLAGEVLERLYDLDHVS